MRFTLTIISIAILALLLEWFTPWWTALLVAALLGFLSGLRPGKAFMAGLLGIGLLWLAVSLFRDIPNEHILSQRMAKLFSLPSGALYLAVTAVIGGLLGGMASWSAALLRGAKAR